MDYLCSYAFGVSWFFLFSCSLSSGRHHVGVCVERRVEECDLGREKVGKKGKGLKGGGGGNIVTKSCRGRSSPTLPPPDIGVFPVHALFGTFHN